ncbi:unnamed protein product [Lupinus luteus]|uniref:SGNH hydrolase-type esterase domain-containing protein n=1 Tax=Lupinus luteus TaxID=3873 RepID=A0AAV1Y5A2_LUPLU
MSSKIEASVPSSPIIYPTVRPKFVLFGSSLVQFSFYEGWGATLAHLYSRQNAPQQPSLVIVYFGGNDSNHPQPDGNGTDVPLEEYKENMRKIFIHIQSLSEKTRIIFLSVPPINEEQLYGNSIPPNPPKTNESQRIYSEAGLEVCKELNIKGIDLWSAIQERSDWKEVSFIDGIHFTKEGSEVVSRKILKVLKEADWEPSLYWKDMRLEGQAYSKEKDAPELVINLEIDKDAEFQLQHLETVHQSPIAIDSEVDQISSPYDNDMKVKSEKKKEMVGTVRPKFVLFGSSIVQHSFYDHGWAAILSHLYSRQADIVLRGYSGWNSRRALQVLDILFPKNASEQPSLVIVYFGGNDSVFPHPSGLGQHVPLQEYIENMRKILIHLKFDTDPNDFQSLSEKTRIIFLGAPPVNEAQIFGNSVLLGKPLRTNESCRIYSEAGLELCRELNIKAIDLWSALQKRDDWRDVCFLDGIHLSAEGNKIVAKEILKVLKEAEWEPSLHFKLMAAEFEEDSPYDPLCPDGNTTFNISRMPFPEIMEWD